MRGDLILDQDSFLRSQGLQIRDKKGLFCVCFFLDNDTPGVSELKENT